MSMKKFLLVSLPLIFAASFAFGQGQIKNNSYFNLSWNHQIMDYGTIDGMETSNNLTEYYKDKYPDDLKHYTGGLDVGANFYIHPISWLIDGFKAGLCVDFIDLDANYYNFKAPYQQVGGLYGDTKGKFNDLTVTYSLNVGVVATVSPMKMFYIDLTAKACPTFGVNYFKIPGYLTGVEANSPIYERRNTGLEWGGYELIDSKGNAETKDSDGKYLHEKVAQKDAETTGIGWGVNYSFGFNLRFYKFSVGCEWLFGNLHFGYEDWDNQTVKNQQLKVKLGMTFE